MVLELLVFVSGFCLGISFFALVVFVLERHQRRKEVEDILATTDAFLRWLDTKKSI